MISEFFGLSNTGKSVLKTKLYKKGYNTLHSRKINLSLKTFFFLKYLLLNPKRTFYFFFKLNSNGITADTLTLKKRFKIFRMRNFYLAFVLAKAEYLKNKKETFLIDEFSLQSLFMILQKKSNKKEIINLIKKLPKSDYLFLFEGRKDWRYKAYEKPHPFKPGTLMPGSWIDMKYARKWMGTMEYNYEIIKDIILRNYLEDKETFKGLKLKYPKILKRR